MIRKELIQKCEENSVKLTFMEESKQNKTKTSLISAFCSSCVAYLPLSRLDTLLQKTFTSHINSISHQYFYLRKENQQLKRQITEQNEEISKLKDAILSRSILAQQLQEMNIEKNRIESENFSLKCLLLQREISITDLEYEISLLKFEIDNLQRNQKHQNDHKERTKQQMDIENSTITKEIRIINTSTIQMIENLVEALKKKEPTKDILSQTIIQIFIEHGVPLSILNPKYENFCDDNGNKSREERMNSLPSNDQSVIQCDESKKKTYHRKYLSPFRFLIEEITCMKIYSVTKCRNMIKGMAETILQQAKNMFRDKKFYLIIDGTPINGGEVENIIMGVLDNSKVRSVLIECHFFPETESITGDCLQRLIVSTLENFFGKDSDYRNNFLFLISDQAKNNLRAGNLSKLYYPELLHISCLVHGIHNLCKTTQNKNSTAKKFLVSISKAVKTNKRNKILVHKHVKVFPPSIIEIRFGLFVKATCFYFNNYKK